MKRFVYRDQDYAFGQLILTLRSAIGFTQSELADILEISRQSVADWEAGRKYPKAKHLQTFIALAVQHQAFSAGQEIQEIRELWKAAHQKVLLDENWLATLIIKPSRETVDRVVRQPSVERQRVDWDDATSVHTFFGREWELNLLVTWLTEERCQVVTLLGQGGIGKSSLAVRLMHQLAPQFDMVIWRSLRDMPTDNDLFTDLIQVLAPQMLSEAHLSPERRQAVLLDYMRNHRILLVLDNLESFLEDGEHSGTLLAGHEGFRRFLRQSAETKHQSCILLTTREKLKDLMPFEGNQEPVRTLRLTQLDTKACEKLLVEKGMIGKPSEYTRLTEAYTGNPLALKIVSQTITDLFAGEVAPFLEQGEVIFGGIRELLAAQFRRLSTLEQTILIWLAILREPATINDLLRVMVVPASRLQVLEAFEALYRRSLIERGHRQGTFTLQSVVLEYATVQFIGDLSTEISSESLRRLIDHAIELSQSREYVRQTQERLLAAPLMAHLQKAFPRYINIEEKLLALLDQLRLLPYAAQGYGPANIVTLLRLSRQNLRGIDMSRLMLRGISLQGVEMQDASLAQSLLVDSVFTETFDAMMSVTISQTGGYWAASSRRGEVRVWSGEGLILHRAWQAHTDLIMALAFSSDEQWLATGSWDRSLKVWDVATGDLLWTGWHKGELVRLAFSPDGHSLVSTGGQEIIVWDPQHGTVLDEFHQDVLPTGVAWSRSGHLLMTSNLAGVVSIWTPKLSGGVTFGRAIHGGPLSVTGIAFSADDKVLATSGNGTTVKLWDIESGQLLHTLEGHTDRVMRVAWSPDGHTIASASRDQTIWLWDFNTLTCRVVLVGHQSEVWGLAFTADSQTLLTTSTDGSLRVWDTATGRCVRVIQSHATPIFAVDWSPDSSHLVSGGADTRITIWDVVGDTPPQILTDDSPVICSLGWSPDGRFIASSDWHHAIRLWDPIALNETEVLQPSDDNGNIFYNLAWSSDGQQLAWGTFKNAVVVFDMLTRSYHFTMRDVLTRLRHVGWSPDGQYVAGCGTDGIIYVWECSDFRLIQEITGHKGLIMCMAWNADSIRLAVGGHSDSGGELTIWDAPRGDIVYTIHHLQHAISTAVWDVDEERIITGDSDGKLHWWDLQHNTVVDVRDNYAGMIQALRRSPDKTKIASCGNDGAVVIWDIISREHLRTLRHDRPYERLDITGIEGFTEDQKAILLALGAIESP